MGFWDINTRPSSYRACCAEIEDTCLSCCWLWIEPSLLISCFWLGSGLLLWMAGLRMCRLRMPGASNQEGMGLLKSYCSVLKSLMVRRVGNEEEVGVRAC